MKQLKGIDISEWNTGLDYTTLSKHIDFVILREGCRQRVDNLFMTHLGAFKALKTPVIGVYHFIYALNNQQAKEEALSAIRNVEKAGLPKSTYIWADFEYDSVTKAAKEGVTLGAYECRVFTETFCKTVHDAGYQTGIYTNLDYWLRMYGDEILSRWPVWYAQYSKIRAKDCMIWQYGSERLPGSPAPLDVDIWYVADEIKPDLSKKTTEELAQEVIAGVYGNGDARIAALGDRYAEVQAKVNELLKPKTEPPSQAVNIDQLAQDVIAGKYGIGDARKAALGDLYDAVQKRVNKLLKAKASEPVPALSDARTRYIRQMQAWVGKKESDGSFRPIIDTYNSGLAAAVSKWGTRNVRMQYDWAWCACTVSAAAMAAGVANIVPIEISCPYMIEIAKKAGIWVENDAYVPTPGDIIMYDWQDSGIGDNQGLADHVGMVEAVSGNQMTIIEGNKNDSVSRRTIAVNSIYIRGYIVPKF